MPTAVSYPGVYIEELPSGVHPITGVATSIAAFVDFFLRGNDNEAIQIFSFADFQRTFGGLDERSEASYAIQQFFLNGGNQAWVVRVAAADSANPFQAANVIVQRLASNVTALTITARNNGKWGNGLRVRIDYEPSSTFNLTVSEVSDSGSISAQETFPGLSMTPTDPRFAATVVNADSALIKVEVSGTDLPAPSGTVSEADFASLAQGTHKTHVKIDYKEGTPSSDEFDVDLGQNSIDTVDAAAARLEGAIRGANPSNPAWSGVIVNAVASRLQVLAGASRPASVVTFSNAAGDSTTTDALKLSSPSTTNVTTYALGSALGSVPGTKQGATQEGGDGLPPGAPELIGSGGVSPPTGLFALDKVDLFNILCLPRIARVDGSNPFAQNQVGTAISSAENYCQTRGAFLVLDTPSDVRDVMGFKQWLSDTLDAHRDRNAAVYFPRVNVADPLNEFRPKSLGASGTIAGVYARTDSERGVWKAPAGTDSALSGVDTLTYKLTDAENGVLNPLGINCLRTFPVYGNVSWGARTLEGADAQASEWKYLPVRRLALFLEGSLYRGTQWVVFEPNDEALWAQIRLNVGAFMHTLFRQGAFQGITPQQAYLVRCDNETTTPDDQNLGVVNIVVGFAPLKPAEFVLIQIQQLAGQTAA